MERYFLIAAASVLALAACSKSDAPPIVQKAIEQTQQAIKEGREANAKETERAKEAASQSMRAAKEGLSKDIQEAKEAIAPKK
jgi:F0F1-type ATP synthase membrane subunit b/b'